MFQLKKKKSSINLDKDKDVKETKSTINFDKDESKKVGIDLYKDEYKLYKRPDVSSGPVFGEFLPPYSTGIVDTRNRSGALYQMGNKFVNTYNPFVKPKVEQEKTLSKHDIDLYFGNETDEPEEYDICFDNVEYTPYTIDPSLLSNPISDQMFANNIKQSIQSILQASIGKPMNDYQRNLIQHSLEVEMEKLLVAGEIYEYKVNSTNTPSRFSITTSYGVSYRRFPFSDTVNIGVQLQS